MRLGEIQTLLGGELRGDGSVEIVGVAGLEDAKEGHITFVASRKAEALALQSLASCFLVKKFIDEIESPQLRVDDPHHAFVIMLERFHSRPQWPTGISDSAFIAPDAAIGKGVTIMHGVTIAPGASIGDGTALYPGVYVGHGSRVGNNCVLYPGVTLMDGVELGDRVIIHASAVIGADGFGFIQRDGRQVKIPQVGGVSIGDDVEIGACSAVDRSTTANTKTTIRKGVKIDNMVQVGHNVTIDEHSVLAGQTGIAGSTRLGKFVMVGGQAAIADHVNIADGTMLGGRAGVMSDLEKGIYSGTPAMPHREWLKASALFARLPELSKRISDLETKIKELTGESTKDDEN